MTAALRHADGRSSNAHEHGTGRNGDADDGRRCSRSTSGLDPAFTPGALMTTHTRRAWRAQMPHPEGIAGPSLFMFGLTRQMSPTYAKWVSVSRIRPASVLQPNPALTMATDCG